VSKNAGANEAEERWILKCLSDCFEISYRPYTTRRRERETGVM